jgi:hypothetical protein
MDDEWELRRVRVPKGTHLSKSKDSEGAQRDLLREDGTNKLLGPAESMAVEEDDLDRAYSSENAPSRDSGEPELPWAAQLLSDVIEEVVESIDWEAVFEHIVAPAAKRTKNRVANRLRSTFRRTKAEIVEFVPEDSPTSSTQVDAQDEDATFALGRDEYRQSVVAVLAAEAFAARQREFLANARVEEDDVPGRLVRAVTLVLEGNASSLAPDELAAVIEFLEDSPAPAQVYRLPRVPEIGNALEPTPDETKQVPPPATPGEASKRR